jgi:sialidase-1
VRKGNGYREVWYKTSTDGGASWSDGINITTQVHRPYLPAINPSYKYPEDWRSYANTPGHAMQYLSGVFKGRIIIAANHSQGSPKDNWEDYFSHVFFTDDHGKTFGLGESVNLAGSNEATAAEISGNRLILNARNQKGDVRARISAISSDGGKTWDKIGFDTKLPDPVCEGSILNIGKINGKHILAFSNPAHTTKRDNLTLRISYDDGETWKDIIPVECSEKINDQHDYTAYSDIVRVSNNELGILYERKDYTEIVFKLVKWR